MQEEKDRVLGWHWLVEFSNCAQMPTSAEQLGQLLESAATQSGSKVVGKCMHEFSPHGLTGVVVIAESHLAIHTWPEYRSICIDLFSCSQHIRSDIAIEILRTSFQPKQVSIYEHLRKIPRDSSDERPTGNKPTS